MWGFDRRNEIVWLFFFLLSKYLDAGRLVTGVGVYVWPAVKGNPCQVCWGLGWLDVPMKYFLFFFWSFSKIFFNVLEMMACYTALYNLYPFTWYIYIDPFSIRIPCLYIFVCCDVYLSCPVVVRKNKWFVSFVIFSNHGGNFEKGHHISRRFSPLKMVWAGLALFHSIAIACCQFSLFYLLLFVFHPMAPW